MPNPFEKLFATSKSKGLNENASLLSQSSSSNVQKKTDYHSMDDELKIDISQHQDTYLEPRETKVPSTNQNNMNEDEHDQELPDRHSYSRRLCLLAGVTSTVTAFAGISTALHLANSNSETSRDVLMLYSATLIAGIGTGLAPCFFQEACCAEEPQTLDQALEAVKRTPYMVFANDFFNVTKHTAKVFLKRLTGPKQKIPEAQVEMHSRMP